ncbi:MAG: tandem-95 repeat protein [Phycisphaerales bacterium]|nr:MAG: tandem-95 repeat protein [Phycisphaerales bacterium]
MPESLDGSNKRDLTHLIANDESLKQNERRDEAPPAKKAKLEFEPLEPRILRSGTWVDADTGDPLAGPTEGNDLFTGTGGDDVADALAGDDTLIGGSGLDTLTGGAGNDVMFGDQDDDTLYGGAGSDEVHGGAGNDEVHGGQQADVLFGDEGNDVLYGDEREDVLDGGLGEDQLYGGTDNDVLISGGGNDHMDGGEQDDTFKFTGAQNGDVITVVGGTGTDTIHLVGYNNNQISDNGSTITVDMGGGESFAINYTNIEQIITNQGPKAPNHAPIAGDDLVSTTEDTPVTTEDLLANDTDVDGDPLTVDSFTQPAHGGVVYNGDGTFTYTPDASFSGEDSFTYTISDGRGGTDTATVTVTVNPLIGPPVNSNPVAVDDDGVTTVEDTPVTTEDLLANDTDPDGDPLTVDSFTQPAHGGVAYNGDGTFTYTPDANFSGEDSFTYTVSDGRGGTDTATVTVTVSPQNDAPIAGDDSISTTEDEPVTTGDLLANDTDPDGDPLTIDSFTQPAHGGVVYNGDGTFTYTPEVGFSGEDSFTYAVGDGRGGTDTATVTVTVNPQIEPPANANPVAVDDVGITTVEDTPVTTEDLLANDTDPDGDPLTVDSFTQPAHGGVVYNGDGTFTYTPDANFSGEDSFTYTVSDGRGGTDTATVTVTVNSQNDPPLAGDDSVSTTEDTPVTTGDVLANDTDPDGDLLAVDSFTQPSHGDVVYNGDGTFTYTPDANFSGEDSFTYAVSDGQGETNAATVTATVKQDEAGSSGSGAPGGHNDAATSVSDSEAEMPIDAPSDSPSLAEALAPPSEDRTGTPTAFASDRPDAVHPDLPESEDNKPELRRSHAETTTGEQTTMGDETGTPPVIDSLPPDDAAVVESEADVQESSPWEGDENLGVFDPAREAVGVALAAAFITDPKANPDRRGHIDGEKPDTTARAVDPPAGSVREIDLSLRSVAQTPVEPPRGYFGLEFDQVFDAKDVDSGPLTFQGDRASAPDGDSRVAMQEKPEDWRDQPFGRQQEEAAPEAEGKVTAGQSVARGGLLAGLWGLFRRWTGTSNRAERETRTAKP